MRFPRQLIIFVSLLSASLDLISAQVLTSSNPSANPTPWQHLEPGLELGTFTPTQKSDIGDSLVRVLRIDPAYFTFRLMNASNPKYGNRMTAREWCNKYGLAAAINASMYQKDYKTSVSMMKTAGHANNSRLSKDNAILAFDPKSAGLPPVRIIDRKCDDWKHEMDLYGTLVQSIRMITCEGQNAWSQQPRKWSAAAVGTDSAGHVLFVHVRSPYTTHDLVDILREQPLELNRLMYVEGGPEAQFYFRSNDFESEFVGSYETGFMEQDSNHMAWPVPNVVGIERKAR